MNGDRDDVDDGLLDEQRFSELLAAYYPMVVNRLLLRESPGVAYEVASRVSVRLLEELSRGKRYPVPFRVVVWQVTRWSLSDYYAEQSARREVAWPEGWDPPADGDFDGAVGDEWVRYMIGRLQGRQHEVAWLRYVEGLEIADIAQRLDISRNAVDQALHNAHVRLRESVDYG